MGLVEEIPDEAAAAQAQPAPREDLVPGPNAEIVDECIAALDDLQVPSTAGAPSARTALRDNGQAFGNDTIAAAVRARKQVSGTVPSQT
jgi:cytochrome c oxidase cbb3-type subunit II